MGRPGIWMGSAMPCMAGAMHGGSGGYSPDSYMLIRPAPSEGLMYPISLQIFAPLPLSSTLLAACLQPHQ